MKKIVLSTKPRRVKAAFIWPFAIVLTFILASFVMTAYFLEVQLRDRALANRLDAVEKLVDQKLGKDTNLMQAVLRSMISNQAIETAFARHDRAALLRKVGPLSTLTLRLVVPWQGSNGLLGYLEIGEAVGYSVDEIRDSLDLDLFVMVDKAFISPVHWQQGLKLFDRQGSWDRFGARVLVAQTTAEVPAALNDSMLAGLSKGETEVFKNGKRQLNLAMLALNDAGGRRIGDLVVMRDITALQQTFSTSVTAVVLLSLLAGTGLLALFYFSLDRVERDYRRQHDLEHQLLRLGTEHQRILQIEKLSALGTMVGEIAHQLNNPLVGVVNLAQLAAREADDPQRTRELLKEIHHAGADCHAFIQSMLRFSKVSSFASKPTPMAEVIEETVLMFRQTERRPITVETRLPEQSVVLTVDPILIRHALFNLLTNAAQATPDDAASAIVIALDAKASPDSGAPGWVLSVSDHGKGIAAEILDKIFLPFFTTRSDGTGLGLPVVQHVALVHGGYVNASSLQGGGTQFAVWLPTEIKLAPEYQPDQ